jgi:hypothetical protein
LIYYFILFKGSKNQTRIKMSITFKTSNFN